MNHDNVFSVSTTVATEAKDKSQNEKEMIGENCNPEVIQQQDTKNGRIVRKRQNKSYTILDCLYEMVVLLSSVMQKNKFKSFINSLAECNNINTFKQSCIERINVSEPDQKTRGPKMLRRRENALLRIFLTTNISGNLNEILKELLNEILDGEIPSLKGDELYSYVELDKEGYSNGIDGKNVKCSTKISHDDSNYSEIFEFNKGKKAPNFEENEEVMVDKTIKENTNHDFDNSQHKKTRDVINIEKIVRKSRNFYTTYLSRSTSKEGVYTTKYFHYVKKYLTLHNWIRTPSFSRQRIQQHLESVSTEKSVVSDILKYKIHPETLLKTNNHELNLFCTIIRQIQKKHISFVHREFWYFCLYFYTYLVFSNYEKGDREHIIEMLDCFEVSFCNNEKKNKTETKIEEERNQKPADPQKKPQYKQEDLPQVDVSFDIYSPLSVLNLYEKKTDDDEKDAEVEFNEEYIKRRFRKYKSSLIDLGNFLNFLMAFIPENIYQKCCNIYFIDTKNISDSLKEILELFRKFIYNIIDNKEFIQKALDKKRSVLNTKNKQYPLFSLETVVSHLISESKYEVNSFIVFLIELYSILCFEYNNSVVQSSDYVVPTIDYSFEVEKDIIRDNSPISWMSYQVISGERKITNNLYDFVPKFYISSFPSDNSLYLSDKDVFDPEILYSSFHAYKYTYKHNIYTRNFDMRNKYLNLGSYISIPCGSEGRDKSNDENEDDEERNYVNILGKSREKSKAEEIIIPDTVSEYNKAQRGPFLIPTNTNYNKCERILTSWNTGLAQFRSLMVKVVNKLFNSMCMKFGNNKEDIKRIIDTMCNAFLSSYETGDEYDGETENEITENTGNEQNVDDGSRSEESGEETNDDDLFVVTEQEKQDFERAIHVLKNMLLRCYEGNEEIELDRFNKDVYNSQCYKVGGFRTAELEIIASIYKRVADVPEMEDVGRLSFSLWILSSPERAFVLAVRLMVLYLKLNNKYNLIVWRSSPS